MTGLSIGEIGLKSGKTVPEVRFAEWPLDKVPFVRLTPFSSVAKVGNLKSQNPTPRLSSPILKLLLVRHHFHHHHHFWLAQTKRKRKKKGVAIQKPDTCLIQLYAWLST